MRFFVCLKLNLLSLVLGSLIFSPLPEAFAQSKPTPSTTNEPQHISLNPYRVRIELSYAPQSRLSARNRSQIQQRLQQIVDRSVGQKWTLSSPGTPDADSVAPPGIVENNWLSPASCQGLARLDQKDLLQRYPAPEFDKLFLVSLEPDGIGYKIAAREFDTLSQRLSPIKEKRTYNKSFLGETTFDLICDLFSSVVTLENVEGTEVTVSEQGSQLLTPDPGVCTLETNNYFQPFFRYLNRDREVKNIQFIPWTYLILDETTRKYATCSIASALRGILGGSRRRVETMALQIKPIYPRTTLSLIPRGTSTQSYAGMRVQTSLLNPQEVRQIQIQAKKQQEETKAAAPPATDYILEETLTNRDGSLTLSADPAHPLIWLYIRSGKALVANVPYIPGIAEAVSIQVPDDRIRLNVEGDLAVLNGELIEAVAELSMEMSRIRKWAKDNEWKKVEAGIRKLESGISPQRVFQDKLTVIRVSATEAAQQQKNRAAQSRITQLCRETEDRIDRFLNPTTIIDFKTEIQDLKSLQQEVER